MNGWGAGGNRGGIVLPVAGCSELARNWNPTNGEVNAIPYKWAIACPAGSMEHRGRPGRGFCQSLGHGKFGFQTRGQRCHLIGGGVMTDSERKPPAWERWRGDPKYHAGLALRSVGAGGARRSSKPL